MNIEDLKAKWNNAKVNAPAGPRISDIKRMQSAQQNAVAIIRRVVILALIMSAVVWGLGKDILPMSVGLKAAYSGMLILLSLFNMLVIYKIDKIDLSNMTVREAFEANAKVIVQRTRLKLTGIVLAVPVFVYLLYEMWLFDAAQVGDNGIKYTFLGGCLGGVVGVIAGLRLDRRVRGYLREVQQMLRDELEEENL